MELKTRKHKVVIALNSAWNLVNFRAGLIGALQDMGFEVVAMAPYDEYASRLAALGCRYLPLPMDTQGRHPLRDALLLYRFRKLLQQEQPSVFLSYTIKPNIYGSMAARSLGIPVVNNIAGLGAVFSERTWLTWLVGSLYHLALRDSSRVFFQNKEDLATFRRYRLVREDKTDLLPGSGVDLERFAAAPMPVSDGRIRFLLVARMLWDKGVGEFVEAARLLRTRHPTAEFRLLGFLNVQNPTAIGAEQMQAWVAEGVVTYLGASDDVRPHLEAADCVVLPSYYREGTPRSLLEAAATGRPIITTDWAGCRDVVDNGINGYLCRPRDPADLAEKMAAFMQLSPEVRATMGESSRRKMEQSFDEKIVIDKYRVAIDRVLAEGGRQEARA